VNLLKNIKITRAMNAIAAGTTNQNSSVIDMQGFEGVAFVAAFGALTATAVTGIKVQQGTLADGSDMADLAGSALAIPDTDDNKLLVTDVYRPIERYVRLVVTRGTANAVIDSVSALQYSSRVKPTTQDSATVSGSELSISPAEGTA
jgi:Flp pilus assembly CpaE family ATPase